jgi:hypothetical protein
MIMLLSSANNTGFAILLMIDEKSFMWMRNSNGPNSEPDGILAKSMSWLTQSNA